MAQLHMFSPTFDPEEAAQRALECDAVLFTETFSEDLRALGEQLGVELREHRERGFVPRIEMSERELGLLRERLEPEYRMLEIVRSSLT